MRPYSPFPTLPRLGIDPGQFDESTINQHAIATEWFSLFTEAIASADVDNVLSLFIDDSFWRDLLALTWNIRTFQHTSRIRVFLQDRLGLSKISVKSLILEQESIILLRPYTDIVWIHASFAFEADQNVCSGIFRLIPQSVDGTLRWRAHCVLTNLEELHGHPERVGHFRSERPSRTKSDSSKDEPTVVIVGAGHCGIELAARLKVLGVPTLVVEKNTRVGDNWRNRYAALHLHDPIQFDQMPYLPFPSTWSDHTPAPKLANWFETYVDILELNVWTSSEITSARKTADGAWAITITGSPNSNGERGTRTLRPKHLVFAIGLAGAENGVIPDIPGASEFNGTILHSSSYKSGQDFVGKKVVVVGACTSAFDICVDCANHGIDVTVYQRGSNYVLSVKDGLRLLVAGLYCDGGPPTDVADRIAASFPILSNVEMLQRITKVIAEADKDMLNGLKKVGFRTDTGILDTGFSLLSAERGAGYYLDVGGCQYLIDGRIKLKNDSKLTSFTPSGLRFEGGSEIDADVVVFATGYGDPRIPAKNILDDTLGSKLGHIWGLDDEGEQKGIYKDCGVEGLWFMLGNLSQSRFYSKHVALQIKAMEEGMFGIRYEGCKM